MILTSEFGDVFAAMFAGSWLTSEQFDWRGETRIAFFVLHPSGRELIAVSRTGYRAGLKLPRKVAMSDTGDGSTIENCTFSHSPEVELINERRLREEAERQLATAREALKWYASCDICAKAVCEGSYCRMEHDDGDRARFALQDRAPSGRDGG